MCVTLILGIAFVMGILYNYFGKQLEVELNKEAAYLSTGVDLYGVDYLEKVKEKDSRITYIEADGTVTFDNQADTSEMKNHSDREEVKKALKYGAGSASRLSSTLDEKTVYRALRLENGDVLRVSSTQYSILALVKQMIVPMCWLFLLMMILSGIFASRMSKKVVEPLNTLDLENPEDNQAYEEVEPLLSRIYKQKKQINRQLEQANQQRESFEAITENMQEGLIVIDRYTMVLSANASAKTMFDTDESAVGQSVYSLNRSENFRRVIENVLEGRHQESDFLLKDKEIYISANPSLQNGKTEGAVLLLRENK